MIPKSHSSAWLCVLYVPYMSYDGNNYEEHVIDLAERTHRKRLVLGDVVGAWHEVIWKDSQFEALKQGVKKNG